MFDSRYTRWSYREFTHTQPHQEWDGIHITRQLSTDSNRYSCLAYVRNQAQYCRPQWLCSLAHMRICTINRVGVLYQVIGANRGKINQSAKLIERHSGGGCLDHNTRRNTASRLSAVFQVIEGLINQRSCCFNLLWHSYHRQHDTHIVLGSDTEDSSYLWQENFLRSVESKANATPTEKGIGFRRYFQSWHWLIPSNIKGAYNKRTL